MATQQFLNSVLSQRGPTALPYSEDVKWLIRQHIVSLVQGFPSLRPETASFTHNDGRSVHLLRADGTIPMTFQNVTYNIPVIIWLMESYPRYSPLVFVNPTRDMVIKRGHPNVNPSGLVSTPYLNNWVYPSSNLADLARNLGYLFSCDPPLYSRKRPSPSENPKSNPNSNSYSSNSSPNPRHNPSSYSSSSGSNPGNNPNPNSNPSPYLPNSGSIMNSDSSVLAPPRGYPPSPYGGRIPSTSEDPSEIFRRSAINKLVESLLGDMASFRKTKEVEMDGLFGVQTVLKQREEELSNGMRGMVEEKEGLEQQLQMVLMNSDVLECWVRDNQGRKMETLSTDEDDGGFVTCDSLSQQMLDSTAADLAIEDTVYSLDRAVQEGCLPFDQYLKNVRMLSREQFFHRAMAAKVRAAQMQAQVANMSARISSYVT